MIYVFIFILGICLGSFANVLIDRTQAKKSIRGRSICDFCNYVLSWLDNIPIISFLILKGQCKKCRKKLSWQYPLVELSTGFVLILTFWLVQNNLLFQTNGSSFEFYFILFYFIFISYILWVIFIWDLKYMIIPDFLVLIGLVSTFIFQIQTSLGSEYFWSFGNPLISALLGGLILGGFFGFIFYISKGKWIGGGDVKLGFWLGSIVGLQAVYFLILFSYVSGAIVAVFLILFFSKKMKSQIPFGPFLIVSAYFLMFNREVVLEVWNNLLI